jgi:hypothetical protein
LAICFLNWTCREQYSMLPQCPPSNYRSSTHPLEK